MDLPHEKRIAVCSTSSQFSVVSSQQLSSSFLSEAKDPCTALLASQCDRIQRSFGAQKTSPLR
jgi:hypothetical protein